MNFVLGVHIVPYFLEKEKAGICYIQENGQRAIWGGSLKEREKVKEGYYRECFKEEAPCLEPCSDIFWELSAKVWVDRDILDHTSLHDDCDCFNEFGPVKPEKDHIYSLLLFLPSGVFKQALATAVMFYGKRAIEPFDCKTLKLKDHHVVLDSIIQCILWRKARDGS